MDRPGMGIGAQARLGDPAVPRPKGAVRASRAQANRRAPDGPPALGSRRAQDGPPALGSRPAQEGRQAQGSRRAQEARRALGLPDGRRVHPVDSAPVGRQAVRVGRRAALDPGTPGMRVPGRGTRGRGARRRAPVRSGVIADLDVRLAGATARRAMQVRVDSLVRGRRIRRSPRVCRPAIWIG